MQKFTLHKGLVAPMDRANVDTDAIIPKQFLKSIRKTGFGPNLFDEWRYLDVGQPYQDNSKRPLNKEFVLNAERYQGASVLLARENFGCGSSREHAVWGLKQVGIRALIGTTFAGIFYDNCQRNGVLAIQLDAAQLKQVADIISVPATAHVRVNLPEQTIELADGTRIAFEIDELRKQSLLLGLDAIGTTLQRAGQIRAFEARHLAENPWLG